jgi:hypothetical protein
MSCARPAAEESIAPIEQPETGVYGQIKGPGSKAAANLWVYAYRSQQGGFRGPADFAARVDADGRYLLDLLPGHWYLVARSRQQGSQTGPPRAGEAWAIYGENPLVLKQREVRRIDLQLQEIAPATLLRGSALKQGDTGFRGQLVGPENVPVAGAIALAYRDRDYRRMPDHSSAVTAADGFFTLYVATAGRYCLLARQGYRGQPVQGELYGLLGTGESACRNLVAGELLDIGVIHLKPYLR